jgi:Acyl-CoA dehydrogenase, C-terminal domain
MMDTAERSLFAEALSRATNEHTGRMLDAALDELGWAEAHADDPRAAVELLFENQGRVAHASGALAVVVGAAAGCGAGTGEVLALPRPGHSGPPGTLSGDGRISLRAVTLREPAADEQVVVVCAHDGSDVAVRVPVSAVGLRRLHGIELDHELIELGTDSSGVPVDLAAAAPADWISGLAAGRRAVAHELAGLSATMLELARQHALSRVQFGRPIAGFQAVRHRLAETHVAVAGARAAADGAWDDCSPVSASMAKAVAGRNARVTMRHAQQVLAGMGFTYEHPFHHYLRRALLLDELLGSSRVLTYELGAEILRTRRLPELLPL